MPKSVINYDQNLPEMHGRQPWVKPTEHLTKRGDADGGWSVAPGRRPSHLLLVPKIRTAVDEWREHGYPGVSETTRRLLEYWFEEDRVVPDSGVSFHYYFCQREAIETLIWLVEIKGNKDAKALIESCGTIPQVDLVSPSIQFQTLSDGTRKVIRYVDERNQEVTRDLPPLDLRRYAFKMATGSGKTWVMAMAIVWAYFHKKTVPDSDLSANFLVVAPNVIVYQRLEKDFADNRIFEDIQLVPPELKGQFSLKVILRGESTEPDSSGNLFLTNIHQLYESQEREWSPQNAADALLGKKPPPDADKSGGRTMLKRVQSLPDVLVLNDEAHHVHDDDLEWNKSLLSIHRALLPKGLALWLDFSATPKDVAGYFPWTVCDYPLAQAVEDRIVKAPIIVTKEDDSKRPEEDPDGITKYNVVEKYEYWLKAAVHRWKQHWEAYKQLDVKPVLFIMAERSNHADAIGEYLSQTRDFKKSEILVLHTNPAGEITKGDLEIARKSARDIDQNEIKVIVSVMMLREGWDVRNVTVVLGLRPFTATVKILPEQVIGRGLRLMEGIGPDRTQTLEVLGTRNLLDTLRDRLEDEGVGVKSVSDGPPLPATIAPVMEKKVYDIRIPITKPRLFHEARNLAQFDVAKLEAIYDQNELRGEFRIKLRMEFQPTGTSVHRDSITVDKPVEELLVSITNMVISRAKLTLQFADLYPKVKAYVRDVCFGVKVKLDDKKIRAHLSELVLREGIAGYLAREIGKILLEKREMEFENADFRLSGTKPFAWRRDMPPLEAKKTVFNFVATYNNFERRFAEFLDQAPDVLRFAALGTTEQGESSTQFRVDYLKPSGAIGLYHPDWVAVQKTPGGKVHWIIETKGRMWPGTNEKDDAMQIWCEQITKKTDELWQYRRIQQTTFDSASPRTLERLLTPAAFG